jgi:hypothetical protein
MSENTAIIVALVMYYIRLRLFPVRMTDNSCLSGVVVSVLAAGPKGCGFEPDQGNGFLRAIKIYSTPSFRWEVKPEAPCCRFYSM